MGFNGIELQAKAVLVTNDHRTLIISYFNKKVDAKIYVIKIKILFLQKNESNN